MFQIRKAIPYDFHVAYLPKNGNAVLTIPTMNDTPFVGKFPRFKKVSNTSEAFLCRPKKIKGRTIAKKPRMWTTSTKPSIFGRTLPMTALTKAEKPIAAQKSRTACHGFGSYDGYVKVIRA